MASASEYDVAIVGGSIAGCTAATLLGRQGARVLLVERASDPAAYKKVCTHYIQASANATLQRLGIEDAIIRAGAKRNTVEGWTPAGWIPWPEGQEAGWNIRREVLDPMLRELATQTRGVTVLLGHSAKAVIEENGRVAGVSIEGKDGAERDARARLVVAADGRQGKLGELAKVPAVQSPHGRFFYFAYYEDLALPSGDSSMVWFGDPDTAYCFRNDAGRTVVAVMPTKERLPAFRANTEEAFVAMIESLPHGPVLRGAKRVSELLGMIEMPNHVRPPAARGMAFIGDAAITSDPMFGIGCGWALQSAEWLADAVGPALVGGGSLDRTLAQYAERHQKGLSEHHKMIADLATGRRFNAIERAMFRAVGRDDALARRFHRLTSRVDQPSDFMTVRNLLRIFWVNLTKPPLAQGPRARMQ